MLPLRIGSLFSGVGGLELGLEWAGVGEPVWQVEKNPFCQQILRRHWPHAKQHDDVQTVGASVLEYVDLICGGFPCQDVSVAGRGAGLTGERSGLWREFARILEELAPPWALVENVSHGRGRWLPRVLADLGRLGYRARPYRVSAAHVGGPHERARIFVVAHASELAGGHQQQRLPGGWPRKLPNEGASAASETGADGNAPGASAWPALPSLHGVDDGVSSRVDRAARRIAIGNAVVPQCAEAVGQLIQSLRLEGLAP